MTFDPTPSRQRKAHDMRRALLVLIALAAFIVFASVASGDVSATSDIECPPGTDHRTMIDDINDDTWVVPAASQDDRIVIGVSIRVADKHVNYPAALTGDEIIVDQIIKHAHLCEQDSSSTTTTSSTTSTTTPGSSTSSIPATTTTAPVTTSMSTPPTSTSTSSVPVPELPPTGSQKTQLTIVLASSILALGLGMIWLGVRRPRRE